MRRRSSARTSPCAPRSIPEPASQAVAGRAPMPTTTAPAGSREPSSRTTTWPGSPGSPGSPGPPVSTRSTRAWVRSTAPESAYQPVIGAATSAGSAPARGRSAASTTVTAQPASRAAVANSAPIQPAPTTTMSCCRASTGRSRSASSRVRSRCTPGTPSAPGSRIGSAPVARTRRSYGTGPSEVSRTCARGRTPRASQPSRSVIPRASKSTSKAEPSAVPSRTALDSGGRS